MSDPSPSAGVPAEGHATEVRFDGRTCWLWWGPDLDGIDCVAAADGQVLSWTSERGCLTAAGTRGWRAATAGTALLDLEPAQRWLSRRRRGIPHESALDLWNLAGDVATSTGRSWHDRSRAADRCYDRLVAANIPWLVAGHRQPSRWTGEDLRTLRRQLDQAVHILRAALSPPGNDRFLSDGSS